MQVFFAFLGGLIEDKEFLLDVVENKQKDVLGYYEILFIMSVISNYKKNELNKIKIDKLNKILLQWLKFVIICGNYRIFLTKLRAISKFIEDIIIDILINLMRDKSIKMEVIAHIAHLLTFIDKKNSNELVNIFINFIKDDSIELVYRQDIAYSLASINRNDNYFYNILLSIIKDKTLDSIIRDIIIKALIPIRKNDDENLNILICLMRDKTNDSIVRHAIAEVLASIGSGEIIINILVDFITDNLPFAPPPQRFLPNNP